MIYKILSKAKTKDWATWKPHKIQRVNSYVSEGRVNSSCSNSGTRIIVIYAINTHMHVWIFDLVCFSISRCNTWERRVCWLCGANLLHNPLRGLETREKSVKPTNISRWKLHQSGQLLISTKFDTIRLLKLTTTPL